VKPVH